MTQLRELENAHHEHLTELGLELLEQAVKNQLEEVPEECRMVSEFDPSSFLEYSPPGRYLSVAMYHIVSAAELFALFRWSGNGSVCAHASSFLKWCVEAHQMDTKT